jgi:hypothetical protein
VTLKEWGNVLLFVLPIVPSEAEPLKSVLACRRNGDWTSMAWSKKFMPAIVRLATEMEEMNLWHSIP